MAPSRRRITRAGFSGAYRRFLPDNATMESEFPARETLYKQVWSRPMIHVAKEYGLSGRGLAKLCARHEVPVPPRGHWAKKAHGHRVPQPPLKPPSRPHLDRIDMRPTPPPTAELPPDDPAMAIPEVAFEQIPENRIVVQPGRRLHPFVKKTATALRQTKPYEGLLHPIGGVLDIVVSRAQTTRALRIMNALVEAIEARGWPMSLSRDQRELAVTLFGEQLAVSLSEKARRVRHIPTPYELKHPDSYRRPYDHEPTGLLRLRVRRTDWKHTLSEVRDTTRQPLEELLNAYLVRFVKTADEWRKHRERREADERRREEEMRRRWEEEKKEREWTEWMEGWEKSQRIRRFAAAVEEAFRPVEPESRIAEWLTWAEAYAERSDPLREARKERVGSDQ